MSHGDLIIEMKKIIKRLRANGMLPATSQDQNSLKNEESEEEVEEEENVDEVVEYKDII